MGTGKMIKRKFKRSPSYPMISLDEAVSRAKVLWDKDQSNPMPKDAVYEHLGYQTQGGYGSRVVAALKKYGLISENKGYMILTNLAVDILIHEPTDNNYIRAIRECALNPSIYRELFDEHNGSLPSDATIKSKLIREHAFNASKVDDFIKSFRETISFSGLDKDENIKEEANKNSEEDGRSKKDKDIINMLPDILGGRLPKTETTPQHFTIPLMKQNKAVLTFAVLPIDIKDLNRIKQWIDLMEGPLTETIEESPFEPE